MKRVEMGVHVVRRFGRAIAAVAFVAVWLVGSGGAAHAVTPKAACVITVVDDHFSTPENTELDVAEPGVDANDTLCGGDGLMISQSQPSHGTLDDFDDEAGSFTYTPDADFVGTDSFTYSIEEPSTSNTATVTITVTAPTTTTTTAPATTTTVASTTTAPAATTTTAAAVAPTSTATPTPTTEPALARTGAPVTGSALLGVGLVSVGLALVLLGRRRTLYSPRHSAR